MSTDKKKLFSDYDFLFSKLSQFLNVEGDHGE